MMDITCRKQVEEALRREKYFAESLIETAQTIVMVLDTSGGIVTLNPYMEEISGYPLKEVQGKDWFSTFLPERDRKQIRDLFLRAVADIQTRGNVNPIVTKDGREVDIEWYDKTLKGEKGNVVGVLAIGQDITERKQVEADKEKLEAQNQQLQKAESLGRMAGAIAHHFNNQLGVVIGNLEMAIDVMPLGAGPIENLTAAMEASNRAAEMSGLMLTYLGQTSGKRELLDISKACLRSLPILLTVMPGKVVLSHDLPTPGPVINANAKQMQQVQTNLVTNAWEAAGEGRGSIHLRVKTVSLSDIPATHRFPQNWQPQDHAYACLEVTDAGSGIADEDIEKLFDPFFSSKFTGRGMGLPVVMGIVRAHGGVITVESELGRGSIFRVFLPVSAEEVLRQPDKAIQPLAIERGGTVLLVEDEEMLRKMAAAMLKHLGFSVIEVKDGVEAVEMFRQRRDEIRCVLCDLTMPHMNGWETLTALRQLAPDIPVILTSGYDEAQVMAGDHPEWPQVFLGKPYTRKELSDAIGQALVSKKK
jgi:PAS domain S-box-containing protein